MHIEPIPARESAVDACARALRHKILTGQIEAGERLPAERRLAEGFGVNRVTVRGALGQLAAAELVRVRQGSGYVVLDYRSTGGPELIGAVADIEREQGRLPALIADLLHVRRHLAAAVLERLLSEPRELGPVVRAVDALEEVAREDGASAERVADADLAVLAALLTASGSTVLGLCLNPVVRVVSELPELRAAMYADPLSNVLGWRALLAAIEAGAHAGARAADLVEVLAARDAATLARIERASTLPSLTAAEPAR